MELHKELLNKVKRFFQKLNKSNGQVEIIAEDSKGVTSKE
jgi:hypothetical protein